MKNLILSLLTFFVASASAQKILKVEEVTDHSIHIIGSDFEGIIFKDNYSKNPTDTSERRIKRFTPSNEDVILAEMILIQQVRDKRNSGDKKYIFSNLKHYYRQYIGYFNNKGEKIIYINSFPVDFDWAIEKAKEGNKVLNVPKWYYGLFKVFDGGKSFWQININLNQKKIIDMSVNGVA